MIDHLRLQVAYHNSLVRQMGLEPIRHTTHAPQTCLSANSSTAAYSAESFLTQRLLLYYPFPFLSTLFAKNYELNSFAYSSIN